MSPGLKACIVAAVGYGGTLLAAFVTGVVVMIALQPHTCGELGRALLILWGMMAVAAVLGIGMVGVLVWRVPLGAWARLAVTAGASVAILGTFALAAVFLMIGFNC